MITRRMKDLPDIFFISAECCNCDTNIAFRAPSSLWYCTDGTENGTHAFCCKACAKQWEKEKEG